MGCFSDFRIDIQAAFLEFVGTTMFLLLGLGGIQASLSASEASPYNTPTLDRVLYIATSMGLSLIVSAWLFYRVTGGLFNPDISLGLLLTGVIGPLRFVLYCIAQLAGAVAASALILALTPGPLASKYVQYLVRLWCFSHELRCSTTLAKGINSAQGGIY
jgi:aquaporin rerated protein, other eukaryote